LEAFLLVFRFSLSIIPLTSPHLSSSIIRDLYTRLNSGRRNGLLHHMKLKKKVTRPWSRRRRFLSKHRLTLYPRRQTWSYSLTWALQMQKVNGMGSICRRLTVHP
jgi:hypothetical protein